LERIIVLKVLKCIVYLQRKELILLITKIKLIRINLIWGYLGVKNECFGGRIYYWEWMWCFDM